MSLAGSAAVETQRVVQQRAVAFLNRVELLNEVRVHLIEERNVLGHIAIVFLFVRQFVRGIPQTERGREPVGQSAFLAGRLK